MPIPTTFRRFILVAVSALALCACDGAQAPTMDESVQAERDAVAANLPESTATSGQTIDPANWPAIPTPPLDPEVEARVDDILSKMTLEQKVGQVIQGDTASLTPEDVKTYRLGSVLSGGNSAPGSKAYATTQEWLDAADAYYEASLDPEGVEVAVPTIWGIDAVHGHTNLVGGVIFPHNVGLGAADDPDLIHRIAEATATELSVSGHDWTFAPTLAVPQNDRWGRGYEGFSEDPTIVKAYGGEIVSGLQGEVGTEEFMGAGRVISTAKHFLGDGGTTDGVDQGDAQISEAELRDVHLPGYETAIAAGAQSVMASFSSWQGGPMHGETELLTDVLKGRMNFRGFVVGDWNGHALIPGCTATDCPQSLNAGLDMYMAPDSWKGLYESTLAHAQSGRIPMERLDDANRRILRAKVQSGLFDTVKPSERPLAGRTDLLGSDEHRALAREAVRKSQVLLKNNGRVLPLDAGAHIHVVGEGADQVTKLAGGWTLSWQGRDHANSEFPNAETFLQAVRREVEDAGGTVTFDADGNDVPDGADAVIAVYGEDPYAEYQGDLDSLDFRSPDFDTSRLEAYREAGLPVVSVFVSGRPLWTNPEINDSDAFVAAWLPGSEPAGITDLLFQTDAAHDFTGRLSFSWPKLATQAVLNPRHADYDPLFELGYGLSLNDDVMIPELPEQTGLDADVSAKGVFFSQGSLPQPFRLYVDGAAVDVPARGGAVELVAVDRAAQEDSVRATFHEAATLSIGAGRPLDYGAEAEAGMELAFLARSLDSPVTVEITAGCAEAADCANRHAVEIGENWAAASIPLACTEEAGVDTSAIRHPFAILGESGLDIALSDVRLVKGSVNPRLCEE